MTRRRRVVAIGAGALASFALGAAALAQTSGGVYDLSWRALSGGGQSTGGTYTVNSGFFGGGVDKYKRFLPVLAKD